MVDITDGHRGPRNTGQQCNEYMVTRISAKVLPVTISSFL
jgi:hypothetical protein